MSTPELCPHCAADLSANRVIGIEVQGVYDGVLLWSCPDCFAFWHRFPEGHDLRPPAERVLKLWDVST